MGLQHDLGHRDILPRQARDQRVVGSVADGPNNDVVVVTAAVIMLLADVHAPHVPHNGVAEGYFGNHCVVISLAQNRSGGIDAKFQSTERLNKCTQTYYEAQGGPAILS